MDVLQAIEKRREITQYRPDAVPEDVLNELIRAAYLAPSGNNLPSREFVLVTDRAKILALKETTPYMQWLDSAPTAVVIVSDASVSKYWLQDASIAGGFFWLTAVSKGLGAAWGAVHHAEDAEETARRERYVRGILAIPESLRVVAVLAVGYPDMEPKPKEMYPVERVLHRESYGQK